MENAINRQTRGACGCMTAGESPWLRAWTAAYAVRLLCMIHGAAVVAAPIVAQCECYAC